MWERQSQIPPNPMGVGGRASSSREAMGPNMIFQLKGGNKVVWILI